MGRLLRTLTALAVAGIAMIPAGGASAQTAQGREVVGIRLLDAPASRRDDPRARLYVVDHVRPGTTVRRRLEVSNDTRRRQQVELYAAGADVGGNTFSGFDGRASNELSEWMTVRPALVDLGPGARAVVTATIAVPPDATGGERYAAIWAQPPPALPGRSGGPTLVNRVGIRVYLSVGGGAEPRSDFTVDTLAAARKADGTPVVTARVTNTGGRALDMGGELRLDRGPGGLSAGPFPARLGTTLGVGGTGLVEVPLDRRVPPGPWDARITLSSGRVQREAQATITFPVATAATAPPVPADPVGNKRGLLLLLAVGLAVLIVVLVVLVRAIRARRRHRGRQDDGRAADTPAPEPERECEVVAAG
ncbi:MAG: peptidase [Actinomycetota bacterium]|nr:peptidase [Actinomycetota bacterium]